MKITQSTYLAQTMEARRGTSKVLADPVVADMCRKARSLPLKHEDPTQAWSMQHPVVKAAYRALFKAGISTSTGFNFFDLRGPAFFLFPVNTPFIRMIGKRGKVNAGVGTAAHWKATTNPNTTNVYVGAQEGQRGATATPNEVDYLATYKELAMEGGETFTAQFAGEGYTDNLADEHFRNLARLRLGEEMMTLLGNSGTAAGNLGFTLGTPTTATINTPAVIAGTASSIPNSTHVSVAVVAITGMGLNPGGQGGYFAPPTVTSGLTTSAVVTNADGSTKTVNGGTSAISAMSSVVETTATNQCVTASTPAIAGASGWAWFVNFTDASAPLLTNAHLNLQVRFLPHLEQWSCRP